MLEYHPEPWYQWVSVGHLQAGRYHHAVLSVGPEQLPCFAGNNMDLSKKYENDNHPTYYDELCTCYYPANLSINKLKYTQNVHYYPPRQATFALHFLELRTATMTTRKEGRRTLLWLSTVVVAAATST